MTSKLFILLSVCAVVCVSKVVSGDVNLEGETSTICKAFEHDTSDCLDCCDEKDQYMTKGPSKLGKCSCTRSTVEFYGQTCNKSEKDCATCCKGIENHSTFYDWNSGRTNACKCFATVW